MGHTFFENRRQYLTPIAIGIFVSLVLVNPTMDAEQLRLSPKESTMLCAATPSTAPTAKSRVVLWPVCRSGRGAPDSPHPGTEGCGFFSLWEGRSEVRTPTSADDEAFWARINVPSRLNEIPPLPCTTLSDAQRGRVVEAQEYLLSSRYPSNAWRWKDVVETSLRIGTEAMELCLELQEGGSSNASGTYDALMHRVSFSKEILDGSVQELAGVLAHEATHAVYHEQLSALANLTPDDVAWALARCGDIREVAMQATESLAYLNHYLWLRANSLPLDNFDERFWNDARGASEGDLHARMSFAQGVRFIETMSHGLDHLRFLNEASDSTIAERQQAVELACGPFIRVDANGRMRYILPTDVEPEFLTDMMELPELGPDGICSLDDMQLEWDHPCYTYPDFSRNYPGIY